VAVVEAAAAVEAAAVEEWEVPGFQTAGAELHRRSYYERSQLLSPSSPPAGLSILLPSLHRLQRPTLLHHRPKLLQQFLLVPMLPLLQVAPLRLPNFSNRHWLCPPNYRRQFRPIRLLPPPASRLPRRCLREPKNGRGRSYSLRRCSRGLRPGRRRSRWGRSEAQAHQLGSRWRSLAEQEPESRNIFFKEVCYSLESRLLILLYNIPKISFQRHNYESCLI
jgi:hypothetical protein